MSCGPVVDDTKPFEGWKISDNWRHLVALDDRSVCGKCKKSRKYFCYTCYLPVEEIRAHVPQIQLPLKVDVIKHCKEIDGKSTAIHAAVICPDDVTIYTYPAIPNYENPQNTLLVFPGKEAKPLEDLILKRTDKEHKFERVIFIDSTWNQCKGIYKDPRIQKMPCVVLKNRITQFWRHQNGSPRWYLSTIEAIHQFFIEYHLSMVNGPKYDGEYDNLLFFFRFMYDKIHTIYDHESLKSYKRPLE